MAQPLFLHCRCHLLNLSLERARAGESRSALEADLGADISAATTSFGGRDISTSGEGLGEITAQLDMPPIDGEDFLMPPMDEPFLPGEEQQQQQESMDADLTASQRPQHVSRTLLI